MVQQSVSIPLALFLLSATANAFTVGSCQKQTGFLPHQNGRAPGGPCPPDPWSHGSNIYSSGNHVPGTNLMLYTCFGQGVHICDRNTLQCSTATGHNSKKLGCGEGSRNGGPVGVAFTADGQKMYAACTGNANAASVCTYSGTTHDTFTLHCDPAPFNPPGPLRPSTDPIDGVSCNTIRGIAAAPGGNGVWLHCEGANIVWWCDTTSNTCTPQQSSNLPTTVQPAVHSNGLNAPCDWYRLSTPRSMAVIPGAGTNGATALAFACNGGATSQHQGLVMCTSVSTTSVNDCTPISWTDGTYPCGAWQLEGIEIDAGGSATVICQGSDPNHGAEKGGVYHCDAATPVTAAPVTSAPTAVPTESPTHSPTHEPTTSPTTSPEKENGWASVSGDPFAKDKNGNKVQFFLPEGELTRLLQCGTMQLYGSAKFSGIKDDHQQWFNRFVVKEGGEESLDVSIKTMKDMLSFKEPATTTETNIAHHVSDNVPAISKKHAAEPSNLTTLNVAIQGSKLNATFAVSYDGFEVDVAQNVSKPIGRGFSETVQYSHGSGLRFDIESATAKKFRSAALQTLHAHLDLKVLGDLKDCNGGLLAEIWGLIPMSRATTNMLQEPEKHNTQ